MKYSLCVIFFLFCYVANVQAQKIDLNGSFNTNSVINHSGQTPFWIWADQLGQVPLETTFNQSGELRFNGTLMFNYGKAAFSGFRLFGKTKGKTFMATELFAGFRTKMAFFQAGAYADTLIQNGLSSSNGNLLNSRNARPYPRISVGTNEFLKAGIGNMRVAGRWEEGILLDKRIIEKPRIHHKNLFLRWGRSEKLVFTLGVDHYAFWGGESKISGKQPTSFLDYLRTIFALKGGGNATSSDQENVAGNSLGQYFFIFRKDYNSFAAELRIIHPFEDKSGMAMFNGFDNLYSIFITPKEGRFLKHILGEFIHTKNQSGDNSYFPEGLSIDGKGKDNYFNHGFYRSGFTYFGNVMGSPLFYPVSYNEDGVSTGIANNRLIAFHIGLDGNMSAELQWKMLLTQSFNYGTYGKEFNPVRKQFSGMGEVYFIPAGKQLYGSIELGVDKGDNLKKGKKTWNTGIALKFGWNFGRLK